MPVRRMLVNRDNVLVNRDNTVTASQIIHPGQNRLDHSKERNPTIHPLLQSAALHSVLRKERRELWQNTKRFELLEEVRKFLIFEDGDDEEDEIPKNNKIAQKQSRKLIKKSKEDLDGRMKKKFDELDKNKYDYILNHPTQHIDAIKINLIVNLASVLDVKFEELENMTPRRLLNIFNSERLRPQHLKLSLNPILSKAILKCIGSSQISKRVIDSLCSSFDRNQLGTLAIIENASCPPNWNKLRESLLLLPKGSEANK